MQEMWDKGSTPESGRSPGEGYGNPLQYSCLENLIDRGAWQAIVHRVTKSQTRLKSFGMHAERALMEFEDIMSFLYLGCFGDYMDLYMLKFIELHTKRNRTQFYFKSFVKKNFEKQNQIILYSD